MAPKIPEVIECASFQLLTHELSAVHNALSVPETEDSWDGILRGLMRLAALCKGNASTYPTDLVSAVRTSSRPIISALNSERTRLSGAATDFVLAAVTSLGSAFDPLIPLLFPALLSLCTRANKVFITRAKQCIAAVLEHTHSPALIPYLAQSINDKSTTLRVAAAEALLVCLNTFNPPDLERESRAREIEAAIKVTATDANADVRKIARKMFDAYKILLPSRVRSFTQPLTPTVRKYLDIKVVPVESAASRSRPPSRPESAQSIRSVPEAKSLASSSSSRAPVPSRDPPATRPTHGRTKSHSVQRPAEPAAAPDALTTSDLRGRPADVKEAKKPSRNRDMPPPDIIPVRPATSAGFNAPSHPRPAVSGPSRPLRPPSPTQVPQTRTGPQRVAISPVTAQPPTGAPSGPMRAGPIRPIPMDEERKEGRVVGGARRVLREPPPEPQPAPEKPAGPKREAVKPSSGIGDKPARPRPISSSLSTPAIPLHAPAPTAPTATKEKDTRPTARAGSRPPAEAPAPRKAALPKVANPSRTTAAAPAPAEATDARKERAKATAEKTTSSLPQARPNAVSNAVKPRPMSASFKPTTSRPAPRKEIAKPVVSRPAAKTAVDRRKAPVVQPEEVPLPPTPPPPAPKELVECAPAALESTPPGLEESAQPSVPEVMVYPAVPSGGDVHTPEQRPRRAMQVEQTPISALVASIERGFLFTNSPLSPMAEGEESFEERETREQQVVMPAAIGPLVFGRGGGRQALRA